MALTITTADEGKTFHVRIGATVTVALAPGAGMQAWNVAAPNPGVLAPTGQALTYRAASPGTAEITAMDRPACRPGEMCAQFIRAFKATVVVDAG